MARWRAALLLFLTGHVLGCAPRVTTPAPDPEALARAAVLRDADASAALGCYLPMEDALRGYESLLDDDQDSRLRRQAFEIAVTLALRERVIGLYPGSYQDAPARLAAGLPQALVDPALQVLGLARSRQGSHPPERRDDSSADQRARAAAAYQALMPHAADDSFQALLLVHLLSSHPYAVLPPEQPLAGTRLAPLSIETAPWAAAHVDRPAFTFAWMEAQRMTTLDEWATWFEAHPSCVEALVPIADANLAARRMGSADAALAQVLDTLPAIVPARVMRGEIQSELGNDVLALEQFEVVTDRIPDHREALLGRLIALSRLSRHDEAIRVADDMVARGEWYLGEALYWKAWNLYHLETFADARHALSDARRLLFNADVHYLGGLIAYREEQWAEARAEFTRALDADPTHCDARFTRGTVHLRDGSWALADQDFSAAGECLMRRVLSLAAAVADVDRAALPADQAIVLRARRQRALDETTEQQQWAAYNRAVALINANDVAPALALVADVVRYGGKPGAAATQLRADVEAKRAGAH